MVTGQQVLKCDVQAGDRSCRLCPTGLQSLTVSHGPMWHEVDSPPTPISSLPGRGRAGVKEAAAPGPGLVTQGREGPSCE